MNKYLSLTLVIFLFGSCSNVDKNIYGHWGVLEIYRGQDELSNNMGNTYLTPKLNITNRGMQFNIDFNSKRMNEFGHFKFRDKNVLELYDMPTSFFNGEYKISITQTEGTNESRSKTFELTLEKDSIYIRAIKSLTKI